VQKREPNHGDHATRSEDDSAPSVRADILFDLDLQQTQLGFHERGQIFAHAPEQAGQAFTLRVATSDWSFVVRVRHSRLLGKAPGLNSALYFHVPGLAGMSDCE